MKKLNATYYSFLILGAIITGVLQILPLMNRPIKSESDCELLDIGAIGYQCDALRAESKYDQSAQLYFKTGERNQSSELFVYAAWQFGMAKQIDSALIAIKNV